MHCRRRPTSFCVIEGTSLTLSDARDDLPHFTAALSNLTAYRRTTGPCTFPEKFGQLQSSTCRFDKPRKSGTPRDPTAARQPGPACTLPLLLRTPCNT